MKFKSIVSNVLLGSMIASSFAVPAQAVELRKLWGFRHICAKIEKAKIEEVKKDFAKNPIEEIIKLANLLLPTKVKAQDGTDLFAKFFVGVGLTILLVRSMTQKEGGLKTFGENHLVNPFINLATKLFKNTTEEVLKTAGGVVGETVNGAKNEALGLVGNVLAPDQNEQKKEDS